MVSRKTSAMTRTRHISATVTGVASERAFATFIGREAPEPAERGMAGRVRRTPLRRILRVRNRRASQLDAPGNLGLVPVTRRTQGVRDRFPHDFLLAPVIFGENSSARPCSRMRVAKVLSHLIPIRRQQCPNRPRRAERRLGFSSTYQRARRNHPFC